MLESKVVRLDSSVWELIDNIGIRNDVITKGVMSVGVVHGIDISDVVITDNKRHISPHKKHKWTQGRVESLLKAVDRNVPVTKLVDNKTGFTERAIRSKLYKLGYKIHRNIAYKAK